jgi:arylsulfatase A-like enzyme
VKDYSTEADARIIIDDLLRQAGWDTADKSQVPDGVLIMWSPVIKSAVALENAALIDIAPTILHILGLPAAKDMSGRIRLKPLNPRGCMNSFL